MDSLDKAFSKIKRSDFLPEAQKDKAYVDAPLSIGFGQTNSQPTTVKMMLEWLEPQPGDKILDVGSGSGWTAALLAYLVGPDGKVYAVEKIPELVEFGRDNVNRQGIKNVKFYEAGKKFGLLKFAPYDRILVSASADNMPQELLSQLKIGGRLVVPVLDSIFIVNKIGDNDFEAQEKPGFAFVPLVG
jgi:protein-L-isoaspartate(D-aspartate) O-methyltransferase